MRLHPAVSESEALEWLVAQAVTSLGVERTQELETAAKPLAEAMAALSAVVLPDELEPLFP